MNQRFEAFMTGITVCYKSIQRIKSMEMTELDLKGAHVMCLFFLHQKGPLTAAQLCQLCAEDKAAVSRSLAHLQEKGYIYTDDKKYRAKMNLTQKGEEAAQQLDGMIEQWVSSIGCDLSEEERNVFYYGLNSIAENLRSSLDKDK